MNLLILSILILLTADFSGPSHKFKEGECGQDRIHEDVRKVTKVREFVYYYCKISDNKCIKGYSMRVKDFDRIMKKVDCKEKK